MDVSSVMTDAASHASKAQAGNAHGIAVLKKAMEVETDTAKQLIQSAAAADKPVPADKLPPNLGQNLNVVA